MRLIAYESDNVCFKSLKECEEVAALSSKESEDE
jgi:hypothetical protein